jgi:hypothetical protein
MGRVEMSDDSDRAACRFSRFLRNTGVVLLTTSWALFATSLFFPVWFVANNGDSFPYPGLTVLTDGWVIACSSLETVGWYANPLLVLATVLVIRGRSDLALAASAAAVGLAVTSLRTKAVIWDGSGARFAIVGHGPAFFLWLSAVGTSFPACLLLYFARTIRRHAETPFASVERNTSEKGET